MLTCPIPMTFIPPSPNLLEAQRLLDSKIIAIEFQAESKLQECVCGHSVCPGSAETRADVLTQNFDWMLQQIDVCNTQLKQLQTIKCWLLEENLTNVLELLQNDTYLQFSEISLEQILRKSALERMRLKHSRQTATA
jgi:hypothetical protein